MPDRQNYSNKFATSNLAGYTVMEIIHHEMGNGLAVISGYTQLLLKSMACREKVFSRSDPEMVLHDNQKWLSYLQVMKESEEDLNDFLMQLRNYSLYELKDSFGQNLVKTDFVSLSKRVIGRLAPLHKDRTLQIQLPLQPLYILCNPLWMELAMEHILNHTITAYTDFTPVVIKVEQHRNYATNLDEVKIEIHFKTVQTEQKTNYAEIFDLWSHTLDERDQDLCIALHMGVLHAIGGKLWIDKKTNNEEFIYISLPLL